MSETPVKMSFTLVTGISSSNRSSRPEVFCKKRVLRNLAKFTGKHLCQRLFFNKVAGQACNFIKKESQAQVFYCKFCQISKKAFFTKQLRLLLLKVI